MYADNTSILNVGRKLDKLGKVTSDDMSKVIQYFVANNLHINLNKTNFTVFKTERNKSVYKLKLTIKKKLMR